MIISLPSTLDLSVHIKTYPAVKVKDFSEDKLAYLLSLIISVPAHNKEIAQNQDGWVPLYSGELAKIAKNYKEYLEYASGLHSIVLDDGARIIEIDTTYSATEHQSRRYRFRERYRLASSLTELQVQDKVISKRAEKERLQQWKVTKRLYPNLVKWFDSRLAIDGGAARAFVQKLRSDDKTSGKGERAARYLSMLHNIASIEGKQFYLKVDTNIQRLHTNLTNLKSELRHFLKYNGESLVSVDITSSQPYMALALLNPTFYTVKSEGQADTIQSKRDTRSFNIGTVAPKIYHDLINLKPTPLNQTVKENLKKRYSPPSSQLSSLIMFSKYLQIVDSHDVRKYEFQLGKGELYEYLAYRFMHRIDHTFVYRKEIKVAVFLVLFTGNSYLGHEDAILKREFKRVFPSVYEVFKLLKKSDKSRLARLLQQVESWLVLDKICTRISRERPDLPLFTIHDSILTTKEGETFVVQVMEEELTRFIRTKPVLAVTYLEPDKIVESQGLLDRVKMGLLPE